MRALFALWCLAAVVSVPAPASAGPKQQFADLFRVAPNAVIEARGYRVVTGKGITHAVVGRWKTSHGDLAGVALMTCKGRRCTGKPVWLGKADWVRVANVVDVRGKPGPLRPQPRARRRDVGRYAPLGQRTRRWRWPAMVVETRRSRRGASRSRHSRRRVSGRRVEHEIAVLSLRARDRSPTLLRVHTLNRYPSGAGHSSSFRLVRRRGARMLQLVERRRRHLDNRSRCRAPKPTEHHWVFEPKRGRYAEKIDLSPTRGC